MKNILLYLSFTLYLLNPIIVNAQPLSQKEKINVSNIIVAYVPYVYNNRYTPCLLEEIYNKLEGENGLTQDDRKFITGEYHKNKIDETIMIKLLSDIVPKIVKISKEVVENSSCYSK